jgi:hypothetical protein
MIQYLFILLTLQRKRKVEPQFKVKEYNQVRDNELGADREQHQKSQGTLASRFFPGSRMLVSS